MKQSQKLYLGVCFTPYVIFSVFLIFTLILTYYDWKKEKLTKWFDVILFSVVGWIGVFLLLLWVATDHHAAAKNYNLLWAFPLHAIAGILLIKNSNPSFYAKYFIATGILSGITLLTWPILPQHLNLFLIPLVGALGIRAFIISRLLAIKD